MRILRPRTHALAGAPHRTRGDNPLLHEFARPLDMHNGRVVGGRPPLESAEQNRRRPEVLNDGPRHPDRHVGRPDGSIRLAARLSGAVVAAGLAEVAAVSIATGFGGYRAAKADAKQLAFHKLTGDVSHERRASDKAPSNGTS